MTPDEIRNDIPADVREALAAWSVLSDLGDTYNAGLLRAIRKPSRTVILPRAEIPAPLTEMPESGEVWGTVIYVDGTARVMFVTGYVAATAVKNGHAYATKEDAQHALDAMLARETVEEEAKADDLSDLIPWAYLDPKWQWAAMDKSDLWVVYTHEPEHNHRFWVNNNYCRSLPITDGAPVHWTETKVRRPEGV